MYNLCTCSFGYSVFTYLSMNVRCLFITIIAAESYYVLMFRVRFFLLNMYLYAHIQIYAYNYIYEQV